MSVKQNDPAKPTQHRSHGSDLAAKILCTLAAFFLWIYVMSVESPEYEQIFSHLTVELAGTDALADKNLAVYSGYGTMIDVTLSGKKSTLSKYSEKDIPVTADLSSLFSDSSSVTAGGRYSVKVDVDVPSGCKLAGKSQDTISVFIDTAMTISVDLTEQRENTSRPEGCFTGTVDFPVDKVTVTGPKTVLNSIKAAQVKLDLTDVTRTAVLTEDVVLLNSRGEAVTSPYIDYSPRQVTVTVPVYKSAVQPVKVRFCWGFLNEDNTAVALSPDSVTVTGAPEVIDRGNLIEPILIDEKIEFDAGRLRKTAILIPTEDVTLSSTQIEVSAVIDPSLKTREILIPGTNIEDTGAKEGVHYTWEREPMIVTLLGPVEALSRIEADDITLVFDMSPYSSTNTGSIRVRADVNVDSLWRSEVLALGSYEIAVTFTEE